MTDPIADLLARIRNGIMARKATIDLPSSKLKKKIAELLRDEGYLLAAAENPPAPDKTQPTLTLALRWDGQHRSAITGLRRVSKPGQRWYKKSTDLPKVRGGLGIAVVSTSKGIMTDRRARKEGIGGEIICEVW
jgi:small subunit ribosomal protein S8